MKLTPEQYWTRDLLLWIERATARPRPPHCIEQNLTGNILAKDPNESIIQILAHDPQATSQGNLTKLYELLHTPAAYNT